MNQPINNQNQRVRLHKEIRERTLGYMLAAFGLIAGLAWNDAIKAFIEYFFPLPQNTLPAKFLYAVFISIVVIFISVYVSRLLQRSDDTDA
ncbi:MAG: DUF5654 family protein [Candidatus Sungbacteria bacterium]|nr:DUF5654 family protein [bacterium]MDZ4260273.1 DUF5654 family protein [Candidatus Sungbacteria bacterium]